MKTLVVYYSKTGTTKKAAQSVIDSVNCDYDELLYDEKAKSVTSNRAPSDYERVILLAPVWAFSLAEPMKIYLSKHESEIKRYDLIVTCGSLGLRGCVKHCISKIGTPPGASMKLKAKHVKRGEYDISPVAGKT